MARQAKSRHPTVTWRKRHASPIAVSCRRPRMESGTVPRNRVFSRGTKLYRHNHNSFPSQVSIDQNDPLPVVASTSYTSSASLTSPPVLDHGDADLEEVRHEEQCLFLLCRLSSEPIRTYRLRSHVRIARSNKRMNHSSPSERMNRIRVHYEFY